MRLINSNITNKPSYLHNISLHKVEEKIFGLFRNPLGTLRCRRYCESFIFLFHCFQWEFDLKKAKIKVCRTFEHFRWDRGYLRMCVNGSDLATYSSDNEIHTHTHTHPYLTLSEMKKICCFFYFKEHNQGHGKVRKTV